MLRQIFQGALDLLYPKACLLCKKKLTEDCVDELICGSCWRGIKKNPPPFCRRCGRSLGDADTHRNICPRCAKHTLHFDRAFSPCPYEGALKELIHKFKYERKEHLGKPLALLMINFIKEFNVPIKDMDCIIPVPLHRARLREREFNQAQILSLCIGNAFTTPVRCDILTRTRNTKRQIDLAADEREGNVQKCFAVRCPSVVQNKKLLLIDDVLTTASTASESSRALKDAGAHSVFVLTLAN
jgi:competence protein ComFC